jgi:DnaA family protein
MIDQTQLPLNIQLRDDAVFSSFYPGDNLEPLNAAKKLASGIGENFVYIWGGTGVGKSHLLEAACHEAFEKGLSAVYIPLHNIALLSASMLEGLEKIPLVCIDDIHCVSGKADWEEALFHLYNRIREQKDQCRLMVSAETSPLHILLKLADLKSRLAFGITYQLHLMDDDQKLEALRLRAHCRGLELSKTVAQFILSRCPRNMTELFATLEKLDQASLAEQRRLTIPFVKQVLKI